MRMFKRSQCTTLVSLSLNSAGMQILSIRDANNIFGNGMLKVNAPGAHKRKRKKTSQPGSPERARLSNA
jgi:hypothetical protein